MDNFSPIITNSVVAKVVSSGVHSISNKETLLTYPNPVNNILYFGKDVVGSAFSLYNLQGSLMFNEHLEENNIDMKVHNIISGNYLWTVLTQDGQRYSGILIKN